MMGYTCPFCGYSNEEKIVAYGTFCPRCKLYIKPIKKSGLEIYLDDRQKKQQTMVRDYLREKWRNKNADRRDITKH